MRFSPVIIVTAITLALGFAATPAFAAIPTVEPVVASAPLESQSLVVSAQAQQPAASRDGFTVQTFDAVGWPTVTQAVSNPFGGDGGYHKGDDFVPGAGAPIFSTSKGVVEYAGWDSTGYGNMILVSSVINGVPTEFRYGHIADSTIAVSAGQAVAVGQYLGAVGSTGNSTGPHLHFEVLVYGMLVDPMNWLYANVNVNIDNGH
jgi:murein DD-endopeptidase MepM/ murein hydrolase activator NlpD